MTDIRDLCVSPNLLVICFCESRFQDIQISIEIFKDLESCPKQWIMTKLGSNSNPNSKSEKKIILLRFGEFTNLKFSPESLCQPLLNCRLSVSHRESLTIHYSIPPSKFCTIRVWYKLISISKLSAFYCLYQMKLLQAICHFPPAFRFLTLRNNNPLQSITTPFLKAVRKDPFLFWYFSSQTWSSAPCTLKKNDFLNYLWWHPAASPLAKKHTPILPKKKNIRKRLCSAVFIKPSIGFF